ncbi:aspartate aminotransferase family protein [Myxococcota bacterium]|nr:aspartate aminotransferase family protein [Myxococcota bacterium]MBU1534831.1 aspartate aminotransferase family protein [Myxococcota bacterium]
MTNQEKLLERAKSSLARLDNSYAYFPEEDTPLFVRGKGCRLYDADGNEYLDLVAGYSALNQGHTHPKMISSLMKQANRLTLTSATLSDVKVILAERLAALSPIPDSLVHFDLGGARAVEGAKILTTAYTGKPKVISFSNSFHGRSTGSLSLYNADTFQHLWNVPRDYYTVNYPHCHHCPVGKEKASCKYECLNKIQETLDTYHDIGGIIVEPALGARGYIFPPKGFFKRIRRICDEHGLLFIDDEVQMGLGRLGKMFACEAYDTVPDIILLSKSLAGGMWPLSAIIGRKEIMERIRPGVLGSTFAGAPLACAAGIAALDVLEEEHLCDRAVEMGAYFTEKLRARLENYKVVGNIDSIGLAIGIELQLPNGDPATEETQKLQLLALRNGLLLQRGGPSKNIINLIPALIITKAEIDEAVDRFEKYLNMVLKEPEVIENFTRSAEKIAN